MYKLNIPCSMSNGTYSKHLAAIRDASVEIAQQSMSEAANELHTLTPDTEIIDETVSCDGTWQRRGFSSLVGVEPVISHRCGRLLDYEILTKYCKGCEYWSKQDHNSPKYLQWKANHKCKANYAGSSPNMESTGAVELWSRSVQKHKLRYTKMIADGDSKSFTQIQAKKPYGETEVEKLSCVGHVQKWMGASLRRLKKQSGKRKLRDGKTIGGRGRLTDKLIDNFQNYYGSAIRSNLGDLKAMQNAVMVILFHSSSTDKKPQHQYCPVGPNSWCGWQRDRANHTTDYKHKRSALPVAVKREVLPTFKRLSSTSVLEKCLDGATQNASESLNALVWNRAPKTVACSREAVEIAVSMAVMQYNQGMQEFCKILKKLSIEPGKFCRAGYHRDNLKRVS